MSQGSPLKASKSDLPFQSATEVAVPECQLIFLGGSGRLAFHFDPHAKLFAMKPVAERFFVFLMNTQMAELNETCLFMVIVGKHFTFC